MMFSRILTGLRTKKMETHLILGVLLSICSLSFSQECDQLPHENIDFAGTDIKFVFSPDANHCQQLCTQHPACLFFTFVREDWTKDNRHFYCYLKTTPSGQPNVRTPLLGVTSGFSLKLCNPSPRRPTQQPCLPKVYQNVDFPGSDYRTLFTADYEECQRACTQDPACQFFTFVNVGYTSEKIRYKCFLKFSWAVPILPVVQRKTNVVSGFSRDSHPTQGSKPACRRKLFPSTEIQGNVLATVQAASPEHCQVLCSAHSICTFFTFVRNNFNCQLKENKIEMVLRAKEGVTSGLPARFCQADESWLQVTHENVDFQTSDIRYELMDDASTCQLTCNEDANCQFFTYAKATLSDVMYTRRRCYLKRAITMPAPPKVTKLANVVSGFQQRNCLNFDSHSVA
ncbi:plasma kallikrein-like [Pseudoliparis swirei]|uniref:plasma kallikrein-like n=1 Tax=Pseudoliparis swirei TaxID=2059687 RepID=UPI0024BDF4D3|nr:plasma kallikrein-like [Pseudoliparis swirei]